MIRINQAAKLELERFGDLWVSYARGDKSREAELGEFLNGFDRGSVLKYVSGLNEIRRRYGKKPVDISHLLKGVPMGTKEKFIAAGTALVECIAEHMFGAAAEETTKAAPKTKAKKAEPAAEPVKEPVKEPVAEATTAPEPQELSDKEVDDVLRTEVARIMKEGKATAFKELCTKIVVPLPLANANAAQRRALLEHLETAGL